MPSFFIDKGTIRHHLPSNKISIKIEDLKAVCRNFKLKFVKYLSEI